MMRKRLLSFLLAIVMVVLAVPAMALPAIAAESGSSSGAVLYSTSFSSDPASENFPTLDLPSADAEGATEFTYGGYDFGGITTGSNADNIITWNGNWVMGSLGVNWDPTITDPKAEGAAPTVDYTNFNPYDDVCRPTDSAYAISHNGNTWQSNSSNMGSGFWLQANHYCMAGGPVFSSESDKNTRTVTAYYGTASLRYTAEYSGIINIGLIANVAYTNTGTDLVVYKNGVEIYRVLNENMVGNSGTPIAGNDCGSITNVTVAKGDAIDFVSLADPYYDYDSYAAADYSSFVYDESKRGYCDFDFTIDYTAITTSPHDTSFSFGGENWPDTTYVHGAINEESYPVYGTATYKNNWEVACMSPSAWNNAYYPATGQKVVSANDHYIVADTGVWMGGNKGAGIYTTNGRVIVAVTYAKVTADADRPNSDPRNVTSLDANLTIRYTAEYAGTATVSVEALTFLNDYNGYFAILHNGERVGDFYPAGEEFSYADGTGWYLANTDATAADFGDIELSLFAGDTIDFVFRGNEYYDYQNFDGVADGTVAEGYKYDGVFAYGAGKRIAQGYDFKVAYDAGYQIQLADSWIRSTDIHYHSTNYNSTDLYFYRWYTADGTALAPDQTAVSMDETCYAMVNPALKTLAGITDDMTLYEAFEKYRTFLKSAAKIQYSGDWTMGEISTSGNYNQILYFGFFSQSNPYMLKTTGTGVKTVRTFDNQYWLSEAKWDESFTSYYNAAFQGTVLNNTTAPADGDVLIKDIKKIFWSTDLYASGTQGNGMAKAPTTVADAAAGKSGGAYTDPFWVRPASQTRAGAYAYKAPKAGTLSLTINEMALQENATFQWALLVNGVEVVAKNELTATALTDTASVVATMNEMIAAQNVTVNAGDLVQIAFYRNTSNGAPRVNLYATGRITPTTGTTASLTIKDSYSLNLYVVPMDETSTFEAGVIINGVKIPGEKQEDGSYKVVAQEKINVSDLTGSSSNNATGDMPGVSVTYTAYELGDSYNVTEEKTITTGALLQTYIDTGDTKTAALAKAIQALAISSAASIKGSAAGCVVDANTKLYLKGTNQITGVALAELRTALGLEADTPIYTKSGSTYTQVADTYKYTNYDSGNNEIYLATLQYNLTGKMPVYNNYVVYTLNDDGETYTAHNYPFTPDASATEVVNVGYAEGVDPTDASQYGYKIVGANVNLGDKISLIVVANANGTNSMYDLKSHTVKVTVGGQVLDVAASEFKTVDIDGTLYMASIVDVPVSMYDSDLALSIVDADGVAVSAEMTYSIKAFCVRMAKPFNNYSSNEYIIRSLFALGKAAKAYAPN